MEEQRPVTTHKPPTILLLGGNGQVGSALAAGLAERGRLVIGQRTISPRLGQTHVAVDLTREASLRETVSAVRPDWIVNAAAYTAVDRAESEPELAEQVNAIAPAILADEARRLGAVLVHYSTDYVFDGLGDQPWREDDTPAPQSVYGRTKLAGERAIAESGCAHLVLRTQWVYAPTGTNFVRTMLRLGSTREQLRVVADQIGAPTSAAVIARTTLALLDQAAPDPVSFCKTQGGLVHVACHGATSWHGFALEIFEQARRRGVPSLVREVAPITSAEYPTPARRPLNSRLDLSRLRERFGIVTPTWQEALAETLPVLLDDWQRSATTV